MGDPPIVIIVVHNIYTRYPYSLNTHHPLEHKYPHLPVQHFDSMPDVTFN